MRGSNQGNRLILYPHILTFSLREQGRNLQTTNHKPQTTGASHE